MKFVFEATGLTKRFEQTIALDQIDLKIRRQSIVGLLGQKRQRQDHASPPSDGSLSPYRGPGFDPGQGG